MVIFRLGFQVRDVWKGVESSDVVTAAAMEPLGDRWHTKS